MSSIRNWKVAAPLKEVKICRWILIIMSSIRNWKVAAPLKDWLLTLLTADFTVQSATEKLRLHWRWAMWLACWHSPCSIRNWKVAAPLKVGNDKGEKTLDAFNPQLKSCGSIEGNSNPCIQLALHWQSATEKLRLHWRSYIISPLLLPTHQSATEKLRLHWRIWCKFGNFSVKAPIRNWKVAAPLKVRTRVQVLQQRTTIRNWKVAAPLKVCKKPSIMYVTKNQSATEKLRLHWRRYPKTEQLEQRTIRNWKVAAPLKGRIPAFSRGCLAHNPQLKSCGSIEGP